MARGRRAVAALEDAGGTAGATALCMGRWLPRQSPAGPVPWGHLAALQRSELRSNSTRPCSRGARGRSLECCTSVFPSMEWVHQLFATEFSPSLQRVGPALPSGGLAVPQNHRPLTLLF